MALQRTLLLRPTDHLFLCPRTYPHVTSLPLPTAVPFRPRHALRSPRGLTSLAAFADYKDHHQYGAEAAFRDADEYPRPAEIPWKKELCNSVQLIGVVGAPVEIKHLNSGKVLAWTRLAVKKSPTDTSWISLTFWDAMAQVAFRHVEKGNQIYVSGRLVTDTVETGEGKTQTYYKVVVQQLNFIERSSPMGATYDHDSNAILGGRKVGSGAGYDMGTIEESWQAFFANPLEWWDNRKTKRNPKYPDFKHKDTGESLWVEGRNNPPWVKSQLAKLDEKMGSFCDLHARWPVSSIAADDLMPF